jgi:hypothetical protein
MKDITKGLRKALYSPLSLCQWLRAPLPLQLALMRLTVRLDKPLRDYLLSR